MKASAMRRTHSPVSRAQQRGFAAVYAAVALISMLTALGLAIDVGNLYFAQRNLQRLATIAAIDGVRTVSGCNGAASVATTDDVSRTVQASLSRNGGDPAMVNNGGNAVLLGKVEPVNGLNTFSELPDGDIGITSVQVNLSRTAPARFVVVPGVAQTAATLRASAAAIQLPVGSFFVGSSLVDLDSSQSKLLNPLLTALLGTSVNLSAVSYQSLASVPISLQDLGVAAGIDVNSNLQDLLDLQLTLPGALDLLAKAAGQAGTAASATVQTLVEGLATAATPGQTLRLGDVLGIDSVFQDVISVTAPLIDTLNLLTALAESAQQGNKSPLMLPITSGGIAGIGALDTFLTVNHALVTGGPGRAGYAGGVPYTQASSAAVTLSLRLNAIDPSGLLSAFSNVISIPIGIDLNVAPARAALDAIQCPTPDNGMPSATLVSNQAVATVKLGTFNGSVAADPPILDTAAPLLTLQLLGLPIAQIVLNMPATATVGSSAPVGLPPFTSYTYSVDPQGHNVYTAVLNNSAHPDSSCGGDLNPCSQGSTQLLSSTISSLVSSLDLSVVPLGGKPIPLPVNTLLSLVTDLILTPVASLLDSVIDPLLALLGSKVGVATVQMEALSVGNPTVYSHVVPATITP